jgi:Protein of unknown function (DUF1631)
MAQEKLRIAARAADTAATRLLPTLSRLAADTLVPLVDAMFRSADEFLFELGNNARNMLTQHQFFDLLREIRDKREAIAENFHARVDADISALQYRAAVDPLGSRDTAPNALSLIAPEQIERDLLITELAARARADWQKELFQLHERLLAIAALRFDERNDPFDPRCIAQSFVDACQVIESDPKTLKVLYGQFEARVLHQLGDFYHKANRILIDAGVLADLSPLTLRKAAKQAAALRRQPTTTDAWNSGPIQDLLSPQQQSHAEAEQAVAEIAKLLRRRGGSALGLPVSSAAAVSGKLVPADALAAMIAEIQSQPAHSEHQGPLDIRAALESIGARRGQFDIAAADQDAIGVVTMLFDTILQDGNLPSPIKTLVSRLQLDVLKVALRDRSFFGNRQHPARALINEIALLGVGWEDGDKSPEDPLLTKLTVLVDELLRGPGENAQSFATSLAKLRGIAEREKQRAQKIERRAAEMARAEARKTAARETVRQELHQRLEQRGVPAVISAFLMADWQYVMRFMLLRWGPESREWQHALGTLDDLLASAHLPDEDPERDRHLEELNRRIVDGLMQAKGAVGDSQSRIDAIAKFHRQRVDTSAATGIFDTPSSPPKTVLVRTTLQDDNEANGSYKTPSENDAESPQTLLFESLRRADEIPVDTWLAYDDVRRGTTRRCKISVRIPETRTVLFTDRTGATVFEKPRKTFALDLQNGHARVIESAPLIDRTLEQMSKDLRRQSADRGIAGRA